MQSTENTISKTSQDMFLLNIRRRLVASWNSGAESAISVNVNVLNVSNVTMHFIKISNFELFQISHTAGEDGPTRENRSV